MLLWGPLIYVFGAYGAFAVQIGLSILSYGLLLRYMNRRLPLWSMWLVLAVLLLGPVWFWFNDHPGIGWHPELTYFPLSLLFLLALLSGQRGWLLLTGTLLVLVKEDGALMAGALHLGFLCIRYLTANPSRSIFGILGKARFWVVLGGWAALFVLGMLFLSVKNNAAEPEPRLQQALTAIGKGLHESTFIRIHLLLLLKTFLLLLPSIGLLLYSLYRVRWRQAGSVLLVYAVAQVALVFSNWVQGATYYGTNPMFDLVSLTWPPRFVLVYSFSVVYVLTVWFQFGLGQPSSRQPVAWVGALLVLIQFPIVPAARADFRLLPMLRDLATHRFDPQKEPLLPTADVAVIQQLAKTIPARSNVFVFDYLIPIFHKHYNIWPTEKQWENADLAIIPNNDFQKLGDRLPRVMKQPYRAVKLDTYTVYVTPAYEPYLAASLKQAAQ
jgi:hypothetical protein